MFVTVKIRRRGGKRLDLPEDLMRGDLHSDGSTMVLQPFGSNRPEDGRRLYGSVVVMLAAGVGGLLIRGYEESGGRAVLQEWEVTPLQGVRGEDGLVRWDW